MTSQADMRDATQARTPGRRQSRTSARTLSRPRAAGPRQKIGAAPVAPGGRVYADGGEGLAGAVGGKRGVVS